MQNEPVSQAVMIITETEPCRFSVEIEGSETSLEVAQIMVKFLSDCLEHIHRETKVHW